MKRLSILCLFSVCVFGQTDILRIASGPRFDLGRRLSWGVSGAGGADNNFIFNTGNFQQPITGLCVFSRNLDTANAHTITENVYINGDTADPISFAGNVGAWSPSANAVDSVALAAAPTNGSMQGLYYSIIGASHVTVVVSDNGVAGGAVDLYVTQANQGNVGQCVPANQTYTVVVGPGGTNFAPGVVQTGGQITNVAGVNQGVADDSFYSNPSTFGGALIVAPIINWSVVAAPASGSQAVATRAAAVALRHIVNCVSFSAAASAAVTATPASVSLLDGAATIWSATITFPVAVGAGVVELPPVSVCGLNIFGSINTAMTLQFSGGITGVLESATLNGYDIQ
jgi:hypothetical protein